MGVVVVVVVVVIVIVLFLGSVYLASPKPTLAFSSVRVGRLGRPHSPL